MMFQGIQEEHSLAFRLRSRLDTMDTDMFVVLIQPNNLSKWSGRIT